MDFTYLQLNTSCYQYSFINELIIFKCGLSCAKSCTLTGF